MKPEYQWDFKRYDALHEFDDSVISSIHYVFLDGFGLDKGWSIKGVRGRLNRLTQKPDIIGIIGLLKNQKGQIYGYAFYEIPINPLPDGTYMLWEDGIGLRKELQRKGWGALSKIVVGIHSNIPELQDKKIGWIGGRTQNPVIMKRYSLYFPHRNLFPFDFLYDSPEGIPVIDYLRQYISEVVDVRGSGKSPDSKYGISKGVYHSEKGGQRNGDYPDNVRDTEDFEEALRRWGFNREAGDAIVVVAGQKNNAG